MFLLYGGTIFQSLPDETCGNAFLALEVKVDSFLHLLCSESESKKNNFQVIFFFFPKHFSTFKVLARCYILALRLDFVSNI